MKSTTLKHKILLIVFGLCIAVLLSEAFFRIGSLLVNKAKINSSYKNVTNYRILCLGDSSTYGLGASDVEKYSYPRQLQKILDKNIPSKKFEVLNLGAPGINSSQLLNRFRQNIIKYKPSLVVVMVGINDPWNLEESNILKFYNASTLKTLYLNMEFALNRLRLFRFLKLVLLSEELKNTETEPHIVDFNNKTRSKGFKFSPLEDLARSEALYSSINENITEMLRIARDYNTDILFMKYHNVGWGSPEKIIYKTYINLNIPVVDNESLFKKAEISGINMRGPDGWHPNDLGYLLIAANVYNKIVSLKFVDGEPVEIKFSLHNQ